MLYIFRNLEYYLRSAMRKSNNFSIKSNRVVPHSKFDSKNGGKKKAVIIIIITIVQ